MYRFLRVLAAAVLTTFLVGCTLSSASPGAETSPPLQETSPTPTETRSPTQTPRPLTPTSTPPPVTRLGVEPGQLNGVTVRFWHGFSGAREQLLIEWAETFNASNTFGITVEIAARQSLFRAVQDAIRAASPPDLTIAFANQGAAWDLESAPPGRALVDLTDYLHDPVYGYDPDELSDFYAAFIQQETVNGKLLGLPAYRSAQVMFYNLSWAQALGFASPPATPDEFRQQACAASQSRGDGRGGWFIQTDTATVLAWLFAFGSEITDENGAYTFNTPETLAAFSFLHDLAASGCAWKPEAAFPNAEFANREGLLYSSSLSGLFFQSQAFEAAGSEDEWTALPFPAQDGQPVTHIFGPAYQIFASSPERQLAAWLFVKWASSPAHQARWTEVSGYFPARASTIEHLNRYVAGLPQWTRVYDLAPLGKNEPALPSWGTVRWVLSDAAAQLFAPGFGQTDIPALLEELDRTANELNSP